MDKLEDVFCYQKELQVILGYNFEEMSLKEIVAYIKEYSIHMTQELHEMLYELPHFKPWKTYNPQEYQDRFEAARKEWIDVMHFFLNISIALGYTANDLYAEYLLKFYENNKRQNKLDEYKPCVEASNEVDSIR